MNTVVSPVLVIPVVPSSCCWNLSASWNNSFALPFNSVSAIVTCCILVLRGLLHMTSSHSMRQRSQSSAVPSVNSRTFLSMVGLSFDLSEGLIFNVTVLYSSLASDGFLCFLGFLEGNRWQVHGGVSMTLAVFWDISQLHLFLLGVNSLCPTRIDR